MFGISGTELLIVAVFGFLLFGPDKLPQMGRTIGRALRQFRETQEKLTAVVQTEVVDPMAAAAQSGAKKAGMATADDDSDADAPASDGSVQVAPVRKETFAERRARLAAEKAEAAKVDAANDSAAGPHADDTGASDEAEPTAAQAAPVAEEEPAVLTTEDLYARRPRRTSSERARGSSAEDDARDADASDAEGGER